MPHAYRPLESDSGYVVHMLHDESSNRISSLTQVCRHTKRSEQARRSGSLISPPPETHQDLIHLPSIPAYMSNDHMLDDIQITPPISDSIPRATRRDKTATVRVRRVRRMGELPTRDSVCGLLRIFRANQLVHFADHVARISMGVERFLVCEQSVARWTF
jgi:hypothetical protein